MNKQKVSRFITVEGIEGVGKSTNMVFLQQYLKDARIDHIVTREPGGTPIAESIRHVLLTHHSESMLNETELLLMFASRAQHLAMVIKPALAKGKWVLCDRFTDATYAYQGGGRGIAMEKIAILEQWVHADLQPDLTILFHAPVPIAINRAKDRSQPDRIETEKEQFFQRVQDTYFLRAKQNAHRFRMISTDLSPKLVQSDLTAVMAQFIEQSAKIPME